jgi:hypothetical protein
MESGAKNKKLNGRPKGVQNKFSATAKENLIAVFTTLGGTRQMADWARENLTEFYKLYARLVPIDVNANSSVTHYVIAIPDSPADKDEWIIRNTLSSGLPSPDHKQH